eukprot:NODE_3785_length_900_cov_9.166882_g3632_i0.p1 GENE.NODE_3785_length_900_cov_9.166882_g3632_i0~~NODE_3785_length_900_cov_9.166882_g3632_i0.p1  ORF type:complete len:288 (+),score=77.13 NODE_3785_length_900_cov_9.166882_g3632_i0:43-864(+)
MQQLSEWQNTIVGAATGVMVTVLGQPVIYCKNARQQGLDLTINPRVLYRGCAINCSCQALVMCSQFMTNGFIKKLFTNGVPRDLTPAEDIKAGFVAGVLSSVVCSPFELVMIQQQRKGGTLVHHSTALLRSGNIFRGLSNTSLREGVFVMGYLGVSPATRKYLRTAYPESLGKSDNQARMGGCLAGGLLGVALTQPIDTVKTCMQGDVERQTYTSMVDSYRTVIRQRGVQGLYRGALWRIGLCTGAFFFIDHSRLFVSRALFPEQFSGIQVQE